MAEDETVAYAIATWARFNEDVTDVLLPMAAFDRPKTPPCKRFPRPWV